MFVRTSNKSQLIDEAPMWQLEKSFKETINVAVTDMLLEAMDNKELSIVSYIFGCVESLE